MFVCSCAVGPSKRTQLDLTEIVLFREQLSCSSLGPPLTAAFPSGSGKRLVTKKFLSAGAQPPQCASSLRPLNQPPCLTATPGHLLRACPLSTHSRQMLNATGTQCMPLRLKPPSTSICKHPAVGAANQMTQCKAIEQQSMCIKQPQPGWIAAPALAELICSAPATQPLQALMSCTPPVERLLCKCDADTKT